MGMFGFEVFAPILSGICRYIGIDCFWVPVLIKVIIELIFCTVKDADGFAFVYLGVSHAVRFGAYDIIPKSKACNRLVAVIGNGILRSINLPLNF